MFIKVCLYAYLGAHAINPMSDSHEACLLASDFAENGSTHLHARSAACVGLMAAYAKM
jgi:hypothetical protein